MIPTHKERIVVRPDARKEKQIRGMLRKVFASEFKKPLSPAAERKLHEKIFHFADWIDDARKLAKLYKNPTKYTVEQWRYGLNGFHYHVIGHLLASCSLDGMVCDPFRVIDKESKRKAIEESKKAKSKVRRS